MSRATEVADNSFENTFDNNFDFVDWPAYQRPAGRAWQMRPSRRVIYDSDEFEAQSYWKADQIMKMLDRNQLYPRELCEVGVLSKRAVEELQTVMGTEVKVQGHEVPLRELELNDCRADPVLRRFLKNIGSAHPTPFDAFLILDVIEHIENYHGFFRAVRPMAEYKILHLPMDLTVHTILRSGALKDRRQSYLHISYFTKDTIIGALQDCGYQILDSFYTPWRIQFGTELSAKLMRLPRRLLFRLSPDLAVRWLGGYGLMILAK